jgi:hypothetical protein
MADIMVHLIVGIGTIATAKCLEPSEKHVRDTKLNFIRLTS